MTTPAPPPISGPGRSAITRDLLDQQLANVAAGFREYLSDVSPAAKLAEALASIPAATLTAPAPDGFGYTADEAYAIGLFGQMLAAGYAWWHGQAAPAQPSPTPAEHSAKFVPLG
jgi:hypothetical protein